MHMCVCVNTLTKYRASVRRNHASVRRICIIMGPDHIFIIYTHMCVCVGIYKNVIVASIGYQYQICCYQTFY